MFSYLDMLSGSFITVLDIFREKTVLDDSEISSRLL